MGAIIGSVGQLFSISRFQTWTAAFLGYCWFIWGLSYYLPMGRDKLLNALGVDRLL